MANEKTSQKVLNALDAEQTQWYHFTATMIAGMGFFTDAYNLFSISLVTNLLGRIYYHVEGSPKPGSLPPHIAATVNGVALIGTLCGQIIFGCLGDKLGRRRVYGITLGIIVISSIASGLSWGHTPGSVMGTLCFFRFWLGYGIGGDYPLSATIMSEYANKKTRGAFIAAVFAMQGFGILSGGLVSIIISKVFKSVYPAPSYANNPLGSTVPEADYIWRLILMFGAVPAILTFYSRSRMPETARYTALVAKDSTRAAADMTKVLKREIDIPVWPWPEIHIEPETVAVPETVVVPEIVPVPEIVETESRPVKSEIVNNVKSVTFGLFSRQFVSWHGTHLLGTTSTWFLVGIAFYSQNLFQKDVFSAIGWIPKPAKMSAVEEVYYISRAQTLIALFSTVPGYWFTVVLVDRVGRFWIQIGGFLMMTVFMFALAIPYHHWTLSENQIGFVAMYSFSLFFTNFGPNSTTFIVPAEIYPARLRSTCHGISAAAGKAGAIVGTFGFLFLAQEKNGHSSGIGIRNFLIFLGCVNMLGMFFTLLVPESKGKSLEEISQEN
ncbi:hypothetical protein MKW94_014377 [Papaver nudicaule]|uniref:Major facilitator superfamily (MFS) profile domain-containing protein n=1 Tax=Papaver nudicaule TaxID=74823 RepID=A0AA41SB39_PAPNU|nr:hypothetical protein [Papaver nudicaule]